MNLDTAATTPFKVEEVTTPFKVEECTKILAAPLLAAPSALT
jgi:hypothetical protein